MRILPLLFLFLSLLVNADESGIEIKATGKEAEATKQILVELLKKYDLKNYIY